MKTLIVNIKKLVQVENEQKKWVTGSQMAMLPSISEAYLLINDTVISDFGEMRHLSAQILQNADAVYDATGKLVLPCFCDSHTHLVYAASREAEFVSRIKGLSYQEIAQNGGGILNSARALQNASFDYLYQSALGRINEIIGFGTGAVEIKSGYGLTLDAELKMLRVIQKLKETTPIEIKATFLGAHAVPAEFKDRQGDYVDKLLNEMIPAVATEKLADFIDVFCDNGFFTPHETDRILCQATKYGLQPKIHANELGFTGGVQVGVKHNALSVDHLEYIDDAEIEALLGSQTMPTILPGAAFFLKMPYSPVRKMISAGLPIALASDYNPGSSPAGNMKFIMSLGCINYNMTPEEVINAVTINGAYAMGIQYTHGSIARGKVASIVITSQLSDYSFLPYAFASNLIEKVMLKGKFMW